MTPEELKTWNDKPAPSAYSEMLRNSLLRSEDQVRELEQENELLRRERDAALTRLETAAVTLEALAALVRTETVIPARRHQCLYSK